MPQENQNDNFSVAECSIYLQPYCLFSKDLSKKIYQFGPWWNCWGPRLFKAETFWDRKHSIQTSRPVDKKFWYWHQIRILKKRRKYLYLSPNLSNFDVHASKDNRNKVDLIVRPCFNFQFPKWNLDFQSNNIMTRSDSGII